MEFLRRPAIGSSTSKPKRSAFLFPNGIEKDLGAEPPEPLSFVLGRDHGGHWIVQETHGLCGGLFASKDAAIHYARSEDSNSVIRLIPHPIELKCSS